MKELLNRLIHEEDGQGMTEYGLILALIAVAAILAFTFLGGKVSNKMNDVGKNL